jgi:hypothetical protein
MKFIVPTLAIIGAISIALSLVFSIELLIKNPNNNQISSQNINSIFVTSTIGNSTFIKGQQGSNASGTRPDGFQGPDASNTPHLIGPKTPPPNY